MMHDRICFIKDDMERLVYLDKVRMIEHTLSVERITFYMDGETVTFTEADGWSWLTILDGCGNVRGTDLSKLFNRLEDWS